jgi:NTP pyrophosphatase (non-canonical NTP hydrolase)
MKINEYQKAVRRTINNDLSIKDQILNFSLGLSGEVGEVIDLIKKEFFQGHKRNNDKLKDEIGDVFWYLVNLCNELGYDIETVLDMNIEKLNKRYPNGFQKEDSENRDKSIKVMLKVIDNYVRERNNIKEKYNDLKLEMSDEDEELIREMMNKQLKSCKCSNCKEEEEESLCNIAMKMINTVMLYDEANMTFSDLSLRLSELEISSSFSKKENTRRHNELVGFITNLCCIFDDLLKQPENFDQYEMFRDIKYVLSGVDLVMLTDKQITEIRNKLKSISTKYQSRYKYKYDKEEDWKDVNDVY